MKVYQRPEFYVEEFVANEYVAACDSNGSGIILDCDSYNSNASFKIASRHQDENGNVVGYGLHAENGTSCNLWLKVIGGEDNTNNLPVFAGPISQNHPADERVSGEYNNSVGQGSVLELCDCKYIQYNSNPNGTPVQNHHHIASYHFVSRS